MIGSHRKCLQIFVEDTDTWEESSLYETIVHLLAKRGIAGATVWNGIMGYGASRRVHQKGLFGVSDEKPVVITAVDAEEKIRAVLPYVLPLVKEGLIVILDAEVFVKSAEDEA